MEINDAPWLKFYDEGVSAEIPPCPVKVVTEILDNAAAKYPDRAAISFKGNEISYAKLKQSAEQIAAALKKHGLAPGSRVGIMLPNLPQTIMALFGVLKAGGIFVMINPTYTTREIALQVQDSDLDMLICLDLFWPKIEAMLSEVPVRKIFITSVPDALAFPKNYLAKLKLFKETRKLNLRFDHKTVFPWSELFSEKKGVSTPATSSDDLAALQYTGGTTGESKGVMLTHHNLCSNVYQIMDMIAPKSKNVSHQISPTILPYFHVYGMMVGVLIPVCLAGTIIPVPRYVPQDLLATLSKSRATLFGGAPAIFISLMHLKEIKEHDLSSLDFCISGSAPIPVEHMTAFKELTGLEICEGYGLTEASPITHLNPVCGKKKFGSIGLPLPSTMAKIVDMEVGTVEVPCGKAGELIIKGPQVMKGYWNRPDDTASTVRNGWLYTGDIALMDEDGYFYIVDRKKDMAIVGGFNVYPREIDEILHEHPKIKEAVSVGIPHPTKGEILKAYIVVKDGEQLEKHEVLAFCREKLAQYKVPRQIEFRADLPRTMVGKVLRRVLRDEEIAKQQKNPAATMHEDED